jgi:LPS sulfotransferase NodH
MHIRDNKFVISCAARTGSTMLVHLLRSNPAIVSHGEVFGRGEIGHLQGSYAAKRNDDPAVGDALQQYRRKDPKRFLYDVVFDTQDRQVAGFKFKTDEQFLRSYRDIRSLLVKDTDVKVIHLVRRDLLSQYISHLVVLRQTGITLLHERDEAPEISPFSIDTKHLLKYVDTVTARERKALNDYRHHRRFDVVYEDLAAGCDDRCMEMQAFLGVEPAPLVASTRKIIKDNYGLVENLEPCIAALGDGGHGKRINPSYA